jgi:hypothetical protein
MRGAVVVTALAGDLIITAGQEWLTLYKFNTMQAEHFFCSRCGIYIYHRRRSNPNQLSVNAACIDGVSPFDFECVPVYDGVVHHSDRPGGPAYRIAGYCRTAGPAERLQPFLDPAEGAGAGQGVRLEIAWPHAVFGHTGWGGSFVAADPAARIGIAYVCNQMRPQLAGDPRARALVDAVYGCL